MISASAKAPWYAIAFARIRRTRLFSIVVAALIATIAVLVIYPLARMFYGILFGTSSFGDYSLGDALSNPELPGALANTALLALTAGTAAIAIGTVLAWVNERTDARLGWLTDILPIIPLLIPPIAQAVGWSFLLAPTGGLLNAIIRTVTGSEDTAGPINIYSLAGLIFVMTIYLVPFAYITVSAALLNTDPALEEASRMSGAGVRRTLVKVTIPSVRTALVTSAVLVLFLTIAIVSIPIILGLSSGIDTLSTLIYRVLFREAPPRLGEAVALSSFMFVVVQVAILFEYFVVRRRRHGTISGRAGRSARVSLGVWRWPVRVLMLLYLVIATVLPLSALIFVSFQPFWTSNVVWDQLSLVNYKDLFTVQSSLREGLVNSLLLGIVTATVLMVIAAVFTFFVHSSRGPLPRLVNAVTGLPASLPHTVVGVAFLVTFGIGALGGTLLLLFLVYIVVLLPQASRSASSSFSQVGMDLWDASSMSGASALRTFRKVLLPLMFTGLIAGWVIVFVMAFDETSASLFLSRSTSNPVVGPVIIDVWANSGTFPQVAALTVIVTSIQTIVVLAALSLRRRQGRYRGG